MLWLVGWFFFLYIYRHISIAVGNGIIFGVCDLYMFCFGVGIFQRTFREIMFLQEFGDHPNVIRLQNVIKAENDKDIYLVFELMGKKILANCVHHSCL